MYEDLIPGSFAGYGNNSGGGGLFESLSGVGKYLGSDSFSNMGKGLGGIAGIGSGLYSMYLGNKLMDMYEDKLDMEKEKWGISKNQLARAENYGNQVGYGYTHGGAYNDASNPYYQAAPNSSLPAEQRPNAPVYQNQQAVPRYTNTQKQALPDRQFLNQRYV